MAMGRRAEQRQAQEEFWIAHTQWPRTVAHPFYQRLNQLLEERGFDEFVEGQCERFYAAALGRLAEESGIATPTREQLAKLDRKRAKKGSNDDWVNPHDPEAEITQLKDGRTHLAYKAEHAVDLETGAVVAVTVGGGAAGDTETILETLPQAGEHIAEVACATNNEEVGERVHPEGPIEAVTDKGYHSTESLTD